MTVFYVRFFYVIRKRLNAMKSWSQQHNFRTFMNLTHTSSFLSPMPVQFHTHIHITLHPHTCLLFDLPKYQPKNYQKFRWVIIKKLENPWKIPWKKMCFRVLTSFLRFCPAESSLLQELQKPFKNCKISQSEALRSILTLAGTYQEKLFTLAFNLSPTHSQILTFPSRHTTKYFECAITHIDRDIDAHPILPPSVH